jgi:hypothetical protein
MVNASMHVPERNHKKVEDLPVWKMYHNPQDDHRNHITLKAPAEGDVVLTPKKKMALRQSLQLRALQTD